MPWNLKKKFVSKNGLVTYDPNYSITGGSVKPDREIYTKGGSKKKKKKKK